MAKAWPIVGVGAVVWDGPDRVLLVRRGQPPKQGEWSLPGGRVEPGETLREALAREVREDTGLEIAIGSLIDVIDLVERADAGALVTHFVLIDFTAEVAGGTLRAASDAAACGWFTPAEALQHVSWDETRRILRLSAEQVWRLKV